jgi:filamentous hemagglutinin family protein
VVAGQVQIQQAVNQLTVQQQSSKAIINWQSFDIGQKATVQFQQPGSNAVALNRVQTGAASQIYGKLVANGQVFLLNANGVLFGPDAQVDVGALVAGAMKITDADFLAGRMNFTEGQGVVTNRGTLSAREAGFIALLAPEVRNEGIIRAQRGTVVLAAGEAITLRNSASGLTVVVDKGALQALIDNRHLVSADDGTVFMTARAASALQQAVVTNSGRIEAKGALRVGGRIRLSADVVNNSGTVDASAAPGSTGQDKSLERSKGGNIQIAASAFTNTGSIRANGDEGGRIEVLASKTLTNEGTIVARGIQGAGGQVVLTSGEELLQKDTGRVVVTSEGAMQAGGDVVLRAAHLQLQGQLDASSEQGMGGRIDVAALQVGVQATQLDVSGEQAGGQ